MHLCLGKASAPCRASMVDASEKGAEATRVPARGSLTGLRGRALLATGLKAFVGRGLSTLCQWKGSVRAGAAMSRVWRKSDARLHGTGWEALSTSE